MSDKSHKIRIVLVGKTGAGKSAAGNSILGVEEFESELSSFSWTFNCKKAEGQVRGRHITIIDTPGLFDTNFTQDEVLKRIKTCISLSAPGPHAFLLVLKLGRFTQEEREAMRIIQSMFGEEAAKYSLVLFTHGDKLKKQTIQSFVSKSKELQELIHMCYGRYHVLNNQMKEQKQIDELLEKIDRMVEDNDGKYYTTQMFRRAKKASKKEEKRLTKELSRAEQQRRKATKAELKREIKLTGGSVKHSKCLLQ